VQDGEQRVRGIELEGDSRLGENLALNWGLARLDGKVTRSYDGDQDAELGDTPNSPASSARVTPSPARRGRCRAASTAYRNGAW
jgi:outer membrane receptor protein involved in Fe transport